MATIETSAARLQALCDAGDATRGLHAHATRGGIELVRVEASPDGTNDTFRCGRLSPLGGDGFGLAIVRHTGRLERVPFTGTVEELHEVMETVLGHVFGQ